MRNVVGSSLSVHAAATAALALCRRERNAVAALRQPSSREVRYVATSRAATDIPHLSTAFSTRFLSHLLPAFNTRFLSHLSPVLITESDCGIGFLTDVRFFGAAGTEKTDLDLEYYLQYSAAILTIAAFSEICHT